MKNLLRIFLLPISLSLLFFATSCRTQEAPETLVYGLTLAPTGIDPHINASAELGIPLTSVYDTLIYQEPETGQFVPGLAERWTISDDATTYTFYLREDVQFHDGTIFNAEAAKANFEYVLNPENLSQKARFMLGPLDRIEVMDAFTLTLHLEEPFAPLLDSLSQVYLGMASPNALAEWGPGEYQFHQVGTGPYRFLEYVPNDHITLQKNEEYAWGPSIFSHAQASIDTIIFRFYEDPATRSLALESGDVDIIGELPPQEAERLDAEADFQLIPVPIPGQPLQILFNTQSSPTDELYVREALIGSVDRATVVHTVFGEYSPVAQGLLSGNFFPEVTYPSYVKYDPQAAASLLETSGWVLNEGGEVRQRGDETLQLQLLMPNWGSNPEVGQLISAAWEELGAQVTLEIAPGFGPLREAQSDGAYHAIGLNFFGTDPDLLRSFYSTEGLYNWSNVHDPEMDDLLFQASQSTLDSERRSGIYEQLATMIREDALMLPIRDYVNLVATRSTVQGLRFSTQGWFPYLIDLQLE